MPSHSARSVETPESYAAGFMFDLEAHDASRPRSQQSDAGVIGVSDLHTCRERVRRTLTGSVQTDVPKKWQAIVGTYVDSGVKEARAAAGRNLLHDVEVEVTLPNGIVLPGHADEIDPAEPSVTDVKTKDALADVRRVGADEQMLSQRNLYYLGALQKGVITSATGITRNVFLDRSGSDDHPHVEQTPFDMDVVLTAQAWLEDAVYAAEHGEEASKDWPRTMCEAYCPFFTACRGGETVQEEWLSGHRARELAAFVAARKERKVAAETEAALRQRLLGITGRSTTHWVRSTVTNGKTGSIRLDADRIEGAA